MKALYKEQKASNAVHLPLYWNVLSFSFIIIEFSLDISFRVLIQHISPLEKGKKRGDYLYGTDVQILYINLLLYLQKLVFNKFQDK